MVPINQVNNQARFACRPLRRLVRRDRLGRRWRGVFGNSIILPAGLNARFFRVLSRIRDHSPRDQRNEDEVSGPVELRPPRRADLPAAVHRAEDDAAVGARFDVGVSAQADRRIQRGCALVKNVERPDIDRAAREIDARRRRGDESHAGIIEVGSLKSEV